eukprot:COSAG03_NODE_924_length_5294_cov_5.101636_3_plen_99_part_00
MVSMRTATGRVSSSGGGGGGGGQQLRLLAKMGHASCGRPGKHAEGASLTTFGISAAARSASAASISSWANAPSSCAYMPGFRSYVRPRTRLYTKPAEW